MHEIAVQYLYVIKCILKIKYSKYVYSIYYLRMISYGLQGLLACNNNAL